MAAILSRPQGVKQPTYKYHYDKYVAVIQAMIMN